MDEEEESFEEKINNSENGFLVLPPRVVIFDILSYHIQCVDRNSSRFDLFGIFKVDRLRYRWYLFTCVEFGDGFVGAISLEHVRFLRVDTTSPFLRDIVQNSSFMKSLRVLEISPEVTRSRKSTSIPSKLIEKYEDEIFSHKTCFINLEILTLKLLHSEGVNWDKFNLKVWENLRELTLMGRNFRNEKVLCSIGNVKSLHLSSIYFEQLVQVKTPFLECLTVSSCTNIRILPGSMITKLSFVSIREEEMMEEIYKRSPNLTSLHLQDCGVESDEPQFLWLLSQEVNPLLNLTHLNLLMVHGFEGSDCTFGPNCSRVHILNCNSLKADGPLFLGRRRKFGGNDENNNMNISSLERLELISLKRFSPFEAWNENLTRNLRSLQVNDLVNTNIDHFLQVNPFSELRYLVIANSNTFVGDRRSYHGVYFPVLEVLELMSLPSLEDSFFQNVDEFPSLRDLSINFCPKVVGEKWKFFDKLVAFQTFGCGFTKIFWESEPIVKFKS